MEVPRDCVVMIVDVVGWIRVKIGVRIIRDEIEGIPSSKKSHRCCSTGNPSRDLGHFISARNQSGCLYTYALQTRGKGSIVDILLPFPPVVKEGLWVKRNRPGGKVSLFDIKENILVPTFTFAPIAI